MPALCRDCLSMFDAGARCPDCGRPRIIEHPELLDLSIAHMDCDAFYASVEKRDDPSLRDKPVIIGGGKRGVVSTACYIARIRGVRSAMPMFQALKLCPDAVVVRGRMSAYVEASKLIRKMMDDLTPVIEPPVAGRGVSGPYRNPPPASRPARRHAGGSCQSDGGRVGPVGVYRTVAQQVSGQGRLGPRQAARVLGDRQGGNSGLSEGQACAADLGCRSSGTGRFGEGGDPHVFGPASVGRRPS